MSFRALRLSPLLSKNCISSFSTNAFKLQEAVKIVNYDAKSITLEGLDPSNPKEKTRFLNFFLRDACPSHVSVDQSTKQKTFSTGEIPLDIGIKLATIDEQARTLNILWNKNLERHNVKNQDFSSPPHISSYPFDFLRSYSSLKNARDKRYLDQPYQSWDSFPKLDPSLIPRIDYKDYMTKDSAVYKAVKSLHDFGLVFVENIPKQENIIVKETSKPVTLEVGAALKRQLDIKPGAPVLVETIGERIGYIKRTFYGNSWNVISIPDAKNVAYTNVYLPLHMDLCYYESPPGIQLLHIIQNSTTGGESLFADSFAAIDYVFEKDPEAYKAMKKVPVTYHYDNDGFHYYYTRPMIVEDEYGTNVPTDSLTNSPYARKHLKAVNYSPPFQGPLDSATLSDSITEEEIEAFQRGLKLFEEYIQNKEHQIEVKMSENTCMLFMNRRILHARNEFDQMSGSRWFRGTYLDLDSYQSKLRMGVRQFEKTL